MVGVVIAAHGRLAEELLRTTVFIVGGAEHMKALDIDPSKPAEKLKTQIKNAIREVNTGDGVLVLTDMFGGTPSNMTLTFLEENKVEVVTGVNLPMLIKLCQCRHDKPLDQVANMVMDYGKKSINQATAILEQ